MALGAGMVVGIRRASRRALIALVVALGFLAAAAPATAATGPDADPWTVEYAGTQTVELLPHGPFQGSTTDEAIVQAVECTVEECVVTMYQGLEVTIPRGQSTGTTTLPEFGTVCDDTGSGERVATVTLRADALEYEVTRAQQGPADCPPSTNVIRGGSAVTFVGEWASGEVCVIEDSPCPGEETAAPTPTAVAAPSDDADDQDADPTGLSSGSASAPSVLSTLATPATAGTAPAQLALAVLVTIILVLLIAFPTALLNSASEAASERLAEWRGRRGGSEEASMPQWRSSWWWAVVGVLLAAVVSAFVDPEFGLNAGSVRVLLSIGAGFLVDVVLGWTIVIWLVRRLVPGATHSYAFQPLSLLLVVAAVLFTRITGFEPGIVFGLVAGVAFGAVLGRVAAARASLAALGWAFGAALVAWVAYAALLPLSGSSFWGTFLVETLASVAIGGMAALPIALVPLRGLAGHSVFSWNRWVWAGCYAVGLVAFFLVLMPMPLAWGEVGWDLWAWIGVYVIYAVVASIAWLALARPWHRDPEPSSKDTATEREAEPAGTLDE